MSLYHHSDDFHNLQAPNEVVPIICDRLRPKSVLDVGCGLGTWLYAFSEKGVADCLGLDGDHVDKSRLKIPASQFKVQDLTMPWDLGRRFDVVMSLEVAEHLPEKSSAGFVEALVRHGDNIIFSAAIPGQGGQNHLNEQWTAYWQEKFAVHGYYFHDVIRPAIWKNDKVDWWYRQNMFLVTKEQSVAPVLDLIHPALFTLKTRQLEEIRSGAIGIQGGLALLKTSVKRWMRRARNG
jgi:cyclopropane fatty-acyl-phospholipid synthase-like methyltransferase